MKLGNLKINIDKEKGKEALGNAIQSTSAFGKKIGSDIHQGVKDFSEKQKQESYLKRMEKYNPLFNDEYAKEDFAFPDVVAFVDSSVRKDIDVCEGAIGWQENENDSRILVLYNDTPIKFDELSFFPSKSDGVYCLDQFDSNRYIRSDCIFNKAHEERMAELKNIAYALGAKYCSIEIEEVKIDVQNEKKDLGIKILDVGGAAQTTSSNSNAVERKGKIEATFSGDAEPTYPKLKWFANDENIKNLIEMRISKNNSIKSETLQLSGSTSATMSHKIACSVNAAIKKIGKASAKIDVEALAQKEQKSTLFFTVEF